MSFSNPEISIAINNKERKDKTESITDLKYLSWLGIFTYRCLIWNWNFRRKLVDIQDIYYNVDFAG